MGRSLSLRLVSGMIAAGLVAASALPATAQEGDDWAAGVSGPAVLSGWQSSPAEGNALTQTLLGFQAKYPNIQVDYQPIAGDYPTRDGRQDRVAARCPTSSTSTPTTPRSGSIRASSLPLDDYIAKSGFDTSQFFAGYADVFKGKDGKTGTASRRTATRSAMAYNSDLVTAPPTTMDDLVTRGRGRSRARTDSTAPMCLNPGLDRGLAFLYANGGELLTEDGTAGAIDTEASKAAVQWYLDLFKNGLGMTAERPGRRLVRRGAGQGLGRHRLRGRLARPVHDEHLPGRQVRLGARCRRLVRRAR